MTGYAVGEPDVSKLSSGISELPTTETKNLGELVREAKEKKGYGIYRLSKHRNKNYKRGWAWRYTYHGKNKTYDFTALDILHLKNKVLLNHLMWRVYDEELARKTAEESGVPYDRLL